MLGIVSARPLAQSAIPAHSKGHDALDISHRYAQSPQWPLPGPCGFGKVTRTKVRPGQCINGSSMLQYCMMVPEQKRWPGLHFVMDELVVVKEELLGAKSKTQTHKLIVVLVETLSRACREMLIFFRFILGY